MRLSVVRVYEQGRKLTEHELRSAEGVVGDVRIQIVLQPDGRPVRQAVCMATHQLLPALIEPQLTGISPLSLGARRVRRNADGGRDCLLQAGVVVPGAVKSNWTAEPNVACN